MTLLTLAIASGVTRAEPWPAWRGDVAGSGVTTAKDLPLEWGKGKNVRWRVALPERGNSTPAVWGDRVFVTQAVNAEHFRGLMCFNRADGKLLWKAGLTYDKPERTHNANPYCSSSPATDGERVVAAYGSAGMVCYDMNGNELWRRALGAISHVWGHSSSPVIYGDMVIHYHGPGDGAYLIALDKKTGEPVWRVDEPVWKTGPRTDGFKGQEDKGVVGSFSTPIIVRSGDRDELVMSFPMEVRSYDPATGKELWRCGGLNPLVYTSPVYADGVIVAMGGYYGNSIGVKTGGSGDVTDSARLWREVRHNGGIGSGVIYNGHLYYHNSGGVTYCLKIDTGETLWQARLPGMGKSWGSFMLAGDRVYTLSQSGETVVFKADPAEFKPLAENTVGEMTNSSLVVSDGDIFIRTHEALWCVGAPNER